MWNGLGRTFLLGLLMGGFVKVQSATFPHINTNELKVDVNKPLDTSLPTIERPNIHLVVYANGDPYEKTQILMTTSANKDPAVATVSSYNEETMLKTLKASNVYKEKGVWFKDRYGKPLRNASEFLKEISKLHEKCHFNKDPYWWIWKPVLIYEKLRRIKDGDTVVYSDASKYYRHGFKGSLQKLKERLMELNAEDGVAGTCLPKTTFRMWSTSDMRNHAACDKQTDLSSFIKLGKLCENAKCVNDIAMSPMRQASWLVLRKTNKTMKLMKLWMELSLNAQIMKGLPYQDQDALALAAERLDFPCAFMPSYRGFPDYINGNDVKHPQPFLDKATLSVHKGGWTALRDTNYGLIFSNVHVYAPKSAKNSAIDTRTTSSPYSLVIFIFLILSAKFLYESTPPFCSEGCLSTVVD